MGSTALELLRLLEATAPDREFEVICANDRSAIFAEDRIQVDAAHWLSVDMRDPPMVCLTDETPISGAQLGFWFIKNPSILCEIVALALNAKLAFPVNEKV